MFVFATCFVDSFLSLNQELAGTASLSSNPFNPWNPLWLMNCPHDPQTSIEKLDFVFYPSPYTLDAWNADVQRLWDQCRVLSTLHSPSTHPPLTLHSDVIIKGKSSQREMWNNYCLTSNESYRTGKAKLVLFSVGSKLWFRRLRTPSPCPSDWWFVLIASFASINVW